MESCSIIIIFLSVKSNILTKKRVKKLPKSTLEVYKKGTQQKNPLTHLYPMFEISGYIGNISPIYRISDRPDTISPSNY